MVGKGARVPMGTEHYALLGFGVEHSHNVLSINAFVVEQPGPKVLNDNCVCHLIKLSNKPFSAV